MLYKEKIIMIILQMASADEFNFDIGKDEQEMNEYRNTSLRPVWNSFDGWCNVKGCNGKFSSFNEYMKHWSLIHHKSLDTHRNNICLFLSNMFEEIQHKC